MKSFGQSITANYDIEATVFKVVEFLTLQNFNFFLNPLFRISVQLPLIFSAVFLTAQE